MNTPFDSRLVSGVGSTGYVYERRHALLAPDADREEGPNIGSRGEHLTITFLSLNRASLSLRLLDSIARCLPDFRGEVLVVDNGSEPAELANLQAACRQQPFRCRLVELAENFGVAGGRNRTMSHVQTEWVLCLDNDTYFVANPLPAVQRALAVLGAHFLNLPLLDGSGKRAFARGGHLYVSVEGDQLYIGAGSAYPLAAPPAQPDPPFLSTFLFGGASVFRRAAFEQIGGYDEGMFIGFEDIDFSIRLFRAGLKIANTNLLALVHDHPPPAAESDRDYERQRFARAALKRSAEHIEAKHGFIVWGSGVEEWLKARHRDLGIAEPPGPQREQQPAAPTSAPASAATQNIAAAPADRPRVALVVDTDNWAFGNIARQLQRHLADRFDFRVVPMDVIDNVIQVLLMTRDCDVVHFFWREHLLLIRAPYYQGYVQSLGAPYQRFFAEIVAPKALSTAIYDHLMLDERARAERRALYTDLLTAYYVGSERLRRVYTTLEGYPRPAAVLPDGVDLGLFHPRNLARFATTGQRELVVGWVGNSKWAAELEDFKGVQTILKPALDELRAEGLPVRAQFADRAESPAIPHDRMVHYYEKIDVYVCTSKIEGTPNPVLESMACGVPVISTDVGIVPQAFGPRQREFLLPARSVACVKAALRRLVAEPGLFRALSEENLQSIQAWDWRLRTQPFADYFHECLRRRAARLRA